MKHLKKIMSLLLVAIMVIAMCVPVMAEGEKHKITAPSNTHQYKIYQIFTGDYSGNKLTNEKWGENGTGDKGSAVDEETLNRLTSIEGQTYTKKITVIKNYVKLGSQPVATISNGNSYDAVPGYYMIKDITDTTYALYIVQVVHEDIIITPKTDQPSFEKKIMDTNDTTGRKSGWQDSADYDIGDQVPFKLEGTVTNNYDDYKTYYFAFHDKEEKTAEGKERLKFNAESVKVFVDNKELSKNQYSLVQNTSESSIKDGCTFEIVFNDLKELKDSNNNALVHAGSKITVTYTSELTENAVIGNQGNVNEAKLEYSNKPSIETSGKPEKPGETPWDNVIVFTYMVEVNKVDQDNNALSGANFKLEKKVPGENNWELVKEIKDTDKTKFEFKGLDDGDYKLTETKTPDGYNTIDPITFTVTATHDFEWTTKPRTEVLTEFKGDNSGNITLTASKEEGKLSMNVVNKSGSLLPETGGIGTTIFYIVGVVLVLGAGVLLVTKKRMNADK